MINLTVFPDTGHQFFEIPLGELLPGKSENWLERFVEKNHGPWAVWDPKYVEYVRYQYAYDDEKRPILRLAVETNLDHRHDGVHRGLLVDEDELMEEPETERPTDFPIYAAEDEEQIEADYGERRMLPLDFLPNPSGDQVSLKVEGESEGESRLNIFFRKPGGRDPVDVDLVVDLGNTRTVALLLEAPGQDKNPFAKRVKVLRFLPRGKPYRAGTVNTEYGARGDECAIIDSWLVLHRPQFAGFEPPLCLKPEATYTPLVDTVGQEQVQDPRNPERQMTIHRRRRYHPQLFVELSPALIGGGQSEEGASRIYSKVPLDEDVRFYLSSPKRYVWDDEPLGREGGSYWSQIPNDTDPAIYGGFDDLSGLIRYFMDPSGIDWDIDNRSALDNPAAYPEAPPSYPRRAAICWYALSIIEAAYRQINSDLYLHQDPTARKRLPRRLRSIRVTFPSGWTHEEQSLFFDQWRRAISLFTLTHFHPKDHKPIDLIRPDKGGLRPVLAKKPLDEAICSQLPILYSDIRSLPDYGDEWFRLYGHKGKVTVMNIDVGGGTTDIAIIRYTQKKGARTGLHDRSIQNSVTLQPKLLFRDGNSIAGDALVKLVIERVLIPAWLEKSCGALLKKNPEAREWIHRFFRNPGNQEFGDVDPRASTHLQRVVRLVFIPLVNELLRRLTQLESRPDAPWESLYVADHVDADSLSKDLNRIARDVIRKKMTGTPACAKFEGEVFAAEARLNCDRRKLQECIDEVFGVLFNSLGRLAGRFKCDLVITSGKPSELPRIRRLLVKSIPLSPQRVVQVKNFPAGDWYPFASIDEGKILDAKTCTVVGAALYQDICNGHLEGFHLLEETEEELSRDYFWGILRKGGLPEDFYKRDHLLFRKGEYPGLHTADEEGLKLEKTFTLPLNCRIGRQRERVPRIPAEPVYKLEWKDPEAREMGETYAEVTLRWRSRHKKGESLELVSIKPTADYPNLDLSNVRLKLNTMIDQSFWLDDPRLNVVA